MAVVTRYFDDAASGAGDGTSYANRAALFTGGAWSTVITGFNFTAATDSLLCLVKESSTHTITAVLSSASFSSGVPSAACPLLFDWCDSSGNILAPANLDWTADQPCDWDSTLPVLATTTNIATFTLANCHLRNVKFTASGRTTAGIVTTLASLTWCSFYHSTSNTAAVALNQSVSRTNNIYVKMTGTSYQTGMILVNDGRSDNIRVEGNLSASSGNRRGFEGYTGTSVTWSSRLCAFNHVGEGFYDTNASPGTLRYLDKCVFANCGGNGLRMNSTASQTAVCQVSNSMITGNGGYGLDGQSANTIISGNRLRSNTSGNITSTGNYPTNFANETTNIYANQAAADAAEYVNSTAGDFRIKYGSPIWGKGYGISDELPPSNNTFVWID